MTQAARGSDKDYCSYWGTQQHDEGDPHHMESQSTGSKDVPWVERCSFCGWIDGDALQRYADAVKRKSVSERAQRIAIATGTEPFAFVEVRDHHTPLTLEEILGQALGAASVAWVGGTGALEFDSSRALAIYKALKREVDLAIEVEQREVLEAAERRVRKYMEHHFSTGTINETALAVQGSANG